MNFDFSGLQQENLGGSQQERFFKAKTILKYLIENMINKNGGEVRGEKEKVPIALAKDIVPYAAKKAGLDLTKLRIVEKEYHYIPFYNADYLIKLDNALANYIVDNIEEYNIPIESDMAIYYENDFIISMELKAYTEISMLKRLAFEFRELRRCYPTVEFVILQLENALGGDFGSNNYQIVGSPSFHSIMAAAGVPVEVLTLLDGKRSSYKAIHHAGEAKALSQLKYDRAISKLAELFIRQVNRKHFVIY